MQTATIVHTRTAPHISLLPMTDEKDELRAAPTTPAPGPLPSEPPTQTEASERPAIAPPSRLPAVPDDDELAQSALASAKPPAWWEGSFIGQRLGKFAADADDIRKGRDRQHIEVMAAIRDLNDEVRDLKSDQQDLRRDLKQIVRDVEGLETRQITQNTQSNDQFRALRSAITDLCFRLEMLEMNGSHDEPLAGRRILVVDDEKLLARSITRSLGRAGAATVVAHSWREVREAVGIQPFDFAVLDIKLDGDDGLQIASWLTSRELIAKERILMMTGHLDDSHAEFAREFGVKVLAKPFGGSVLVKTIRESLEAAERPEAPPG